MWVFGVLKKFFFFENRNKLDHSASALRIFFRHGARGTFIYIQSDKCEEKNLFLYKILIN